jgi:protein-S-isoprenylcysteine O-methyltransferase Ste14
MYPFCAPQSNIGKKSKTYSYVGTLIALLVGIILIGIQVRLEEEYLTSTHGDTYIEYRRNVRRWI